MMASQSSVEVDASTAAHQGDRPEQASAALMPAGQDATPCTSTTKTSENRCSHRALGPAPGLDQKGFATLQARAALLGVSLVRSTDDRDREVFIASKWSMTRQLDSIAAVEELLQRIGGPDAR